MSALTQAVIRQALIEYVNVRAPYALDYDGLNDDEVREALADYVATRYSEQSLAFQDQQMNRIVPRVQAAMAEIQRMRST